MVDRIATFHKDGRVSVMNTVVGAWVVADSFPSGAARTFAFTAWDGVQETAASQRILTAPVNRAYHRQSQKVPA